MSGRTRRMLLENLFRIGRWGSWRGVNGLRIALALLGFLAIGLGVVCATVASGAYEHRARVNQARSPVITDQPAQAALRWLALPAAIDDHIVEVVFIRPLSPQAPLPPGLSRWPAPGEAVLSPALADILDERGVPHRYGVQSGRIGDAGLVSRAELLAYVQLPEGVNDHRELSVVGFGITPPTQPQPFGETLYDRPLVELLLLIALLLILPGLLALVSAARVVDPDAERRLVLLDRLGAGRVARAIVSIPRLLVAAALSSTVLSALVVIAAFTHLPIPLKGQVVASEVVRDRLALLVAAIVLSHVVGLIAAAALTVGLGDARGHRLTHRQRVTYTPMVVVLLVMVAQPWIVARAGNPTVVVVTSVLAAAVIVACLPATLAVLLRMLSSWRAERALRAGNVGRFLGWRITGFRTRGLSWLATVVAALVVVVGHLIGITAVPQGSDSAIWNGPRHGDAPLLVVVPEHVSASLLTTFAHRSGLGIVALIKGRTVHSGRPGEASSTITGECADLKALGVSCADGPLRLTGSAPQSVALAALLHESRVEVRVGRPILLDEYESRSEAADEATALLFALDDGYVDAVAVAAEGQRQGVVFEARNPGVDLGAADLREKSTWLLLFGIPGILALLLMAVFTWAAVVIQESATLTGNPLFVDRQDIFDGVSATRVATPVALAGLAGALVTTWLLAPLDRVGVISLPTNYLTMTAVVTIVSAALGWWLSRRLLTNASRRRWA